MSIWTESSFITIRSMTGTIPSTAIIISATLSLFGAGPRQDYPYVFCYFPNSPYNNYAPTHYGPNRVDIYRATAPYTMSTVTWNTQPSTQGPPAVIPESNVPFYYNVAVDGTSLVQNMIAPGVNNEFVLQLETEDYYRSMNFYSSDSGDDTQPPLLQVEYTIPCKPKRVIVELPNDSASNIKTDGKI